MSATDAERRPGEEAAQVGRRQQNDTARVPTSSDVRVPAAPVVDIAYNDPPTHAYIVTVTCPWCGRPHRHGVVPADPVLSLSVRDAVCGAGRYRIDLDGLR